MKVLFLVNFYPNRLQPYRGVFFREQAKAIQRQGVDVDIISPILYSVKDKVKSVDLQMKSFDEEGRHVLTKGGINFGGRTASFQANLFLKISLRLFKEYIEQHGVPDVIHAHFGIWAGWAAFRISKKYDIPYVLSEHSSNLIKDNYSKRTFKKLDQTYKGASKVIAVGQELKSKLEDTFGLKYVQYIPNVVNTEVFKPTASKKADRIISIGQLRKLKRFDLLIESFSLVLQKHPQYTLTIVGQGPEMGALKNLAEKLDISERIDFTGAKDQAEISDLMNGSKIFALCSEVETFGVVFIEAMSIGLPCVATKTGGANLLIDEKNGLLCDHWRKEEMANCLSQMIENYDNYDQKEIREDIVKKYSMEKVGSELKAVYKEALNSEST